MSETSSDTESSCGWTIISNEGSDIEPVGSDAVVEGGTEMLESPTLEQPDPLESQALEPAEAAESLDDTLGEQTVEETLHAQVFSSSDHSDIVTLRELKEGEHAEEEEEAAAAEELYLGTSCSSHYTFTASEIVFPVLQPAVTNSSSSDDEVGRSSTPVIRRRRVRKNTTSVLTDPEEEEEVFPESRSSEGEGKGEEEEPTDVGATATLDDPLQTRGGGVLNRCVLLALIVAVSVGFGHFYGTVQIQERQKTAEKIPVNELAGVRDLLQKHVRSPNQISQRTDFDRDDLDKQQVISFLTEVIEKINEENQKLSQKQDLIQAQREDLKMLLTQTSEERTNIMSQQQSLKDENLMLKNSLEQEEKSLSVLQEELRNLRSKIRHLEAMGTGKDSLLSENQKLKNQLEEERQLIRDTRAEAQTVRERLEEERKVSEEMRNELNHLRSRIPESGREDDSEVEDLQRRLMELERRLSFEQQRSDLWERLYVETKDENAKGEQEFKVKRGQGSIVGKMKKTFDAVKNSTKEFVHHHKEQIKKAKEAVKENLRKFSDSVKSTFRHFKDSASTFFDKAQGFYKKGHSKEKTEASWQRRTHKPHQRHGSDSHQSNTRKPGSKVHPDPGHHKAGVKGCIGVFDCAYQESMSLFNTAMEPIRIDEFYLLLQSYLQQEVEHFYHWKELEMFLNDFFHNGLFIHDRMLFTDFVSGVEDYLTDMHEYHGLDDHVFGDLDDYVYKHVFGEAYTKSQGPRGPFQRPDSESKEAPRTKQRKQQKAKTRTHSDRKWNQSGRNTNRHMADVKIELGPMPFDPKY